jgi:hypothetical protein
LFRRYVAAEAAGAATYNNQNKRSRKWQTPFVHTNGTAAARTLPTTQKRKEKKRQKKNWRMDGWTKNNQPLLIPYPFSSLAPSHPLPLSLKTISFPRVDDEMLLNIGT